MAKETTNEQTVETSTVFQQASEMTLNQAVSVLAQTATIAQKHGILTVNDAVLVARALEMVKYNEKA